MSTTNTTHNNTFVKIHEGEITESFRRCWFDVCKGQPSLFEQTLGVKIIRADVNGIWVKYEITDPKKYCFARLQYDI
jgi:hypothetical protein